MDSGEDHHRLIVLHAVNFVGNIAREHVGYLLIHLEEVAIALHDDIDSQPVDGLREVEEHSQSCVVDTVSGIATLLGSAACHVARHQVAEGWIATLQIVVAVFFRNFPSLLRACLQRLSVFELLGHPDASVVAQRLRHQRQLGLLVAVDGDTGGVNLYVGRIGKDGTLAVALYGSGAVATHRVGRKEVGITVTARSNDDGIGREAVQLACDEVLGNDATGATVDDDEVFHLITGEELHLSSLYLTAQRRVGTEQQLLTCLSLGIEGTAHLCSTEGTVRQHAAILAGKGYALGHTLVDDVVRNLCQTVYVSLTSTVVATLHGVVEEAVDGVAVVLIVLGCIDTTLCSDGVCTTGGVLDAEVEHIKAHLTE